jgi:hypothetical protein
VFPCIYAILNNKKEVTYFKFLEHISLMIGNCNPRLIMTDFEKASINALRRHFPNVNISGCQFYLSQAINRKIQELRLSAMYKTNYLF